MGQTFPFLPFPILFLLPFPFLPFPIFFLQQSAFVSPLCVGCSSCSFLHGPMLRLPLIWFPLRPHLPPSVVFVRWFPAPVDPAPTAFWSRIRQGPWRWSLWLLFFLIIFILFIYFIIIFSILLILLLFFNNYILLLFAIFKPTSRRHFVHIRAGIRIQAFKNCRSDGSIRRLIKWLKI